MCFRSQSPSAAKVRIPKARMERKTPGFRRQTVLKRIHLISGNRLRISEFPHFRISQWKAYGALLSPPTSNTVSCTGSPCGGVPSPNNPRKENSDSQSDRVGPIAHPYDFNLIRRSSASGVPRALRPRPKIVGLRNSYLRYNRYANGCLSAMMSQHFTAARILPCSRSGLQTQVIKAPPHH